MLVTAEFENAIEDLYKAFEDYRRRSFTDPCLHCHTTEQEHVLHSKPLRHLEAKDLFEYAMSALYTWGDEADFKHFLPRMFELVVSSKNLRDFVDPQMLFGKLAYASWWTWPERERKAIIKFTRSLWRAAISTPPSEMHTFDTVADWIGSVAQMEDTLQPYLSDWIADESEAGYLNLAKFIREDLPFSRKGLPPYWENRREQWNELLAWFRSPAVREKLERGVERWANDDIGNELYEAATLLS